jgi:hypothetical protein
MTLIASSSDYTDRDFAALNRRLKSLAASVFPKWTSVEKANFANFLRELNAFCGDVLGFYQDAQAGESRITTAVQMRNMLKLVRLLCYQPRSPVAAQTDFTVVLAAPVPNGRTVTFTPPWRGQANPLTVSTSDTANPVEFELQAPIVIAAGQDRGTGSVKNCHRIGNPDSLASDPGEAFISTGMPNQIYRLPQAPYLDGSAVVMDDIGTWEMASSNSLVTADATDRVYRVEVDENEVATLRFGDGVCGAIPNGTVKISYATGGGAAGNEVPQRTLKKVEGQFVDSAGDTIQIDPESFDHDQPAGGLDGDDIETVRENAPLSIQTLSRTVTREDYQNQAILAGMQRALMLTQSENAALDPNTSQLFCVPMGAHGQGGSMSSGQRDDVQANISQEPSSAYPNAKPGLVGFQVSIQTAPYVDVGIRMRVYLKKSISSPTTALAIVAALQARFALRRYDASKGTYVTNEDVDFGFRLAGESSLGTSEIPMNDLLAIVEKTPGVREVGDADADFVLSAYRMLDTTTGYDVAEVVQTLQHTDIPLQPKDFPRLKARVFGGIDPDIVILDGDNSDAQLYP